MPAPKRPAFKIEWRVSGNQKWGNEIAIYDPKDPYTACIMIQPADGVTFSYNNENEARDAAIFALRDLADRIERGEQ